MTEFTQIFIDGFWGGLMLGLVGGFAAYAFYCMARLFHIVSN